MFNKKKIEDYSVRDEVIRESFKELENRIKNLDDQINALCQHFNIRLRKQFLSNPWKVLEGYPLNGLSALGQSVTQTESEVKSIKK